MRRLTALGLADSIYYSTERTPLWRVLLYDLIKDSFSDIVLGNSTQIPHNLTDYVESLSISEEMESASTLKLTLRQSGNYPSPYMFTGLRVIQVLISEQRLNERGLGGFYSLFIGPCQGQPGWTRSRDDSGGVITLSCTDRWFYYNKRQLNTREFVQGEDLGDIGVEIATTTPETWGMGLEREEILFGVQNYTIQHTIASIRDVSYTEGFDLLFFIPGKRVCFNGDGKLVAKDTDFIKPPSHIYTNEDLLQNINWPEESVDINNAVSVLGLSSSASEVLHKSQVLAEVRGTIGYFKDKEEIKIYYSDDRRTRAKSIRISTKKIDGWLIRSTKVSLRTVDEFHCILIVDGNNNKWVFVVFLVVYLILIAVAALINGVPLFGGIGSAALWIVAAIWLTLGLTIMQEIGTYYVEISGEPYEYVYKEVLESAEWSHVQAYEKREKQIENHLVHNATLAKTLAKRELIKETCKRCPRNLTLLDDPSLETDDVIEFTDGSRWYVSSIQRDYKRSDMNVMTITGWMVKSGPESNQTGYWSIY